MGAVQRVVDCEKNTHNHQKKATNTTLKKKKKEEKEISMDTSNLYSKIDLYNTDAIAALSKKPFDAKQWLKWYKIFRQQEQTSAIRGLRVLVQETTIQACELNKVTKPSHFLSL